MITIIKKNFIIDGNKFSCFYLRVYSDTYDSVDLKLSNDKDVKVWIQVLSKFGDIDVIEEWKEVVIY